MTVEITSIQINKDYILLEGTNLDDFLFSEDLDIEMSPSTKTFKFDRKAFNGAQMKYLYKLVKSQKACEGEKTMAGKLMKLSGQILNIPGSFLDQDPKLIEEKPKKNKTK